MRGEARGRMNYTPDASVLLLSNTPAHHSIVLQEMMQRTHFVPNTKYLKYHTNTKVLHPNNFLSSLFDVDLTHCRLILMIMMVMIMNLKHNFTKLGHLQVQIGQP